MSPVRYSSAAARVVRWGSTVAEITAGITPIRTSVKANVASAAQTARSAAAIRPRPPATLASTGFGHSRTAASTSPSIPAGTVPLAYAAAVSFRSAPEQKTGPVWSSTITRTASSATAAASPASSSVISGVESALRLCGLSRVSVVTPWAVATRTSASGEVMPGHTSGHARRPSSRRARPGRRVAARVRRASVRPGFRGVRARALLREPVRLLRLQHVHADELGGGTSREGYTDTVLAELALAARVLADAPPPRVETVFVGGGTPTLLPADDLARILDAIDRTWGLAADAEVTTEANPESVTPTSLKELRAAGFTRISLGMQSAAPGVLAVLDRRHSAGRATAAALEARDAGFDHVNLDLIYGTPGERPRTSPPHWTRW